MRFATKYLTRAAMVLLCGAALASIPAKAQDAPPPPPAQGQMGGPGGGGGMRGMDPERRSAMLKQRLNLSDDQTTQIKAILTDSASKRQALMNDPDRRTKMQAMMQDENTKIKAVLTDDQKKQYDDMQAQMRGRMGGGGPPQ
jgi:periplasmic protein CpxP/Spy